MRQIEKKKKKKIHPPQRGWNNLKLKENIWLTGDTLSAVGNHYRVTATEVKRRN
jgi:hypothetical protein